MTSVWDMWSRHGLMSQLLLFPHARPWGHNATKTVLATSDGMNVDTVRYIQDISFSLTHVCWACLTLRILALFPRLVSLVFLLYLSLSFIDGLKFLCPPPLGVNGAFEFVMGTYVIVVPILKALLLVVCLDSCSLMKSTVVLGQLIRCYNLVSFKNSFLICKALIWCR